MKRKAIRSTTRTDCGHGGAIRRAGEVRASTPIRVLVAVIAALLAVQLMPVTAYAGSVDAHIISGPSLTPIDDLIGASIAAPDRYIAAALLMGYSPDTVSGWDDDIKAKLSNEQTGGSFYTFAQNSVQNYYDATEHTGIFKTFLDYVGGTFWNTAETLYGNNLWAALYTAQEFESASRDLASILSGGNVGGGGGSGGDTAGFPATLNLTKGVHSQTVNTNRSWFKINGTKVSPQLISDVVVTVRDGGNHNVALPSEFEIFGCVTSTTSNSATTWGWGYIYFIPPGLGEVKTVDGVTGLYVKDSCKVYWSESSSTDIYSDFVLDGSTLSFTCSFSYLRQQSYSAGSRISYESYDGYSFYYGGPASSEPVVPPTQWPDEPSAPTPPELPEPGTNPTVTPTPWTPVISPTFDFDLNITTEPTSNDLIDWVKKIYYELRSFHGDAHDWFDEVGKGIDGLVDAIDDAQEQIYGELQTIDDTLRSEGQRIRDYMYQMFHWLKDQLDFQNDSFNDSNIVYWLKRIWSKLGSGDINLRPTDPTNDPDDWWDWLVKAVQNFLIGLAATSTELISEIADLASQVMHEFPFSIPWDIAAVLAALSTAPITPVFTITVPAIDGWWATFDFVIDMSPFNGAAETIRLMEKLLFTGLLIWKSKDLLDFMDVTKWFN